MRPLALPASAGLIFALVAPGPSFAAAPVRCSHAEFAVEGVPLTATLCVPADAGTSVTVSETFARGANTFDSSLPLDVVPGASVSRTVQDVPLAALGSAKSLHLTIRFQAGVASIEHALLLPGATPLK